MGSAVLASSARRSRRPTIRTEPGALALREFVSVGEGDLCYHSARFAKLKWNARAPTDTMIMASAGVSVALP